MIKLAENGIIYESVVDGPGLRMTIFTQGCPHNCKGCHNPETHDFSGGKMVEVDTIVAKFISNPLLSGITFSGGEPFLQAKALVPLAKKIIELGKNCWIYSGYTFEQLLASDKEGVMELLQCCNILVDGKFEEDKRDLNILFRGSRNQRLVDLKLSLEAGYAIELEE